MACRGKATKHEWYSNSITGFCMRGIKALNERACALNTISINIRCLRQNAKCHLASPKDVSNCTTRSSAQGNCSAKSLAGNVINSSLSFLSSRGGVQGQGGLGGGLGRGGGWGGGEGFGEGEGDLGGGGRGHCIHLAIYCTATWCFALKGLRTITRTGVEPGWMLLSAKDNLGFSHR